MTPATALADMDKLSPQQLSAMFKAQRDMFKKNPEQFKKMAPQFANMPNSLIETQLNMMADMPPDQLKSYMSGMSKYLAPLTAYYTKFDAMVGGYGRYFVQAFMALALVLALMALSRLIGWFVGWIMGWFAAPSSSSSSPLGASSTGTSMGGGNGAVTPDAVVNQVVLEDDDGWVQQPGDL